MTDKQLAKHSRSLYETLTDTHTHTIYRIPRLRMRKPKHNNKHLYMHVLVFSADSRRPSSTSRAALSKNLPHKPKMSNPRSSNPTGGNDPRSKYRKRCVSCLMHISYHVHCKNMLFVQFNVNEQLSSGWTALLHACNTGREEMVELLLERGADPIHS